MKKSGRTVRYYPDIVRHLVKEKLYFSAIPYIKEYLTTTKNGRGRSSMDTLIDRVITQVGIKQFEVLPTRFLERSRAPSLRYILARKYFRMGKYNKALQSIRGNIGYNHPAMPFALHLEATILSIQKKYFQANDRFKKCVYASRKDYSRYKSSKRKKQLRINKDSCTAGIARNHFAARKYESAAFSYLDVEKSSPIWPEILFEEAWNAFYRKNYNRTLGKLVTYKAPILNYIYNPEIDVLRAMAYMKLCLWDDTKNTVDDFYKKYEGAFADTRRFVRSRKRNLKVFFRMATDGLGNRYYNTLLDNIINSLSRDSTYQEMHQSFLNGKKEMEKVERIRNRSLKRMLMKNLRDSLKLQRDLIGGYVRKLILTGVKSIEKMFEGMSYIKLEVLSRKKTALYGSPVRNRRQRGELRYLSRNDKQYFWTFNGEFWADELGDYVFALKSECS